MAVTTFPRFLELPKELQIQIWEEAIKSTIRPHFLTHPLFAHNAYHTNRILCKLLTGPSLGRALMTKDLDIPTFHDVMNTCRFSRMIALEWWKYIIGECYGMEDEFNQGYKMRALDGFIEGLKRGG